jgi:hypothetical protein
MTIQEARELLWPKYSYLTDEQIKDIEMLIRSVCKFMIRKHRKRYIGDKKEKNNIDT